MITLYRPANYNNPRASKYTGRSIDTKPTIDNKSDAQPLDVYIIALGAGSAIG